MRLFKTFILLLVAAACHAQYVQPMGYRHYSFPWQVNMGSGNLKITNPSAYLEVGDSLNSKKGLLLPRGSKDSIAAPAEGLFIYDRKSKKIKWFNGTAWDSTHTTSPIMDSAWQSGDTLFLHRSDTIFSFKFFDSTSLSNRINLKLNISDTAAAKWQHDSDTLLFDATKTDLATAIAAIPVMDTANKWVSYITKTTAGDSLVFFVGGSRYAIADRGLVSINNIYNNDGTLTGNRTLNAANNGLAFDSLLYFSVNSSFITQFRSGKATMGTMTGDTHRSSMEVEGTGGGLASITLDGDVTFPIANATIRGNSSVGIHEIIVSGDSIDIGGTNGYGYSNARVKFKSLPHRAMGATDSVLIADAAGRVWKSTGGAPSTLNQVLTAGNNAYQDFYIRGARIGIGNAADSTNIAFGYQSLNSTSSVGFNSNSAFGYQSLKGVTTGSNNTGIGGYAGWKITSGNSNTAIGAGAMANVTGSNVTGSNNTAIGTDAMNALTSGAANVTVGSGSGQNISTGSSNVIVGHLSANKQADGTTNINPSTSVYIGNQLRGGPGNDANAIVIGFNSIGLGSNTTVIGNSSTTLAKIYGANILNGNGDSLATKDYARSVGGGGSSNVVYTNVAGFTSSGLGETDGFSFTLPANTLNTDGDFIEFDYMLYSSTSGTTHVARFYMNGVNLASTRPESINGGWRFRVKIVRKSSTEVFTNSQTWGFDTYGEGPAAQVWTIDWTQALPIKLSLQPGSGTITANYVTAVKFIQ